MPPTSSASGRSPAWLRCSAVRPANSVTSAQNIAIERGASAGALTISPRSGNSSPDLHPVKTLRNTKNGSPASTK